MTEEPILTARQHPNVEEEEEEEEAMLAGRIHTNDMPEEQSIVARPNCIKSDEQLSSRPQKNSRRVYGR